MVGDIVGYCLIKSDATTCAGARKPEEFIGKILRVMEFNPEGDVLVVNQQGTALAMFDACDVKQKFECDFVGDYIIPPNLNYIEKTVYASKWMNRQGGYNNIIKQMVIAISLAKGKYSDASLLPNPINANPC
jgi:hypothetical protein